MRIESKKYLYDIARAAANAMSFAAGKTFAAYDSDPMLRSAVERQLEIVGEALSQLARIKENLDKQCARLEKEICGHRQERRVDN